MLSSGECIAERCGLKSNRSGRTRRHMPYYFSERWYYVPSTIISKAISLIVQGTLGWASFKKMCAWQTNKTHFLRYVLHIKSNEIHLSSISQGAHKFWPNRVSRLRFAKKSISWFVYYSAEDKIPFGSYLVYYCTFVRKVRVAALPCSHCGVWTVRKMLCYCSTEG